MASIVAPNKFAPTFALLKNFFLSSYNGIARPQFLKSVFDQPFAQESNTRTSEDVMDIWSKAFDFVGRNSRTPKKVIVLLLNRVNNDQANHGARPCSSVMRRLKKRAYYRKPNFKVMNDQEAAAVKI